MRAASAAHRDRVRDRQGRDPAGRISGTSTCVTTDQPSAVTFTADHAWLPRSIHTAPSAAPLHARRLAHIDTVGRYRLEAGSTSSSALSGSAPGRRPFPCGRLTGCAMPYRPAHDMPEPLRRTDMLYRIAVRHGRVHDIIRITPERHVGSRYSVDGLIAGGFCVIAVIIGLIILAGSRARHQLTTHPMRSCRMRARQTRPRCTRSRRFPRPARGLRSIARRFGAAAPTCPNPFGLAFCLRALRAELRPKALSRADMFRECRGERMRHRDPLVAIIECQIVRQ